jgi:hypothetical protein
MTRDLFAMFVDFKTFDDITLQLFHSKISLLCEQQDGETIRISRSPWQLATRTWIAFGYSLSDQHSLIDSPLLEFLLCENEVVTTLLSFCPKQLLSFPLHFVRATATRMLLMRNLTTPAMTTHAPVMYLRCKSLRIDETIKQFLLNGLCLLLLPSPHLTSPSSSDRVGFKHAFSEIFTPSPFPSLSLLDDLISLDEVRVYLSSLCSSSLVSSWPLFRKMTESFMSTFSSSDQQALVPYVLCPTHPSASVSRQVFYDKLVLDHSVDILSAGLLQYILSVPMRKLECSC